MNQITVYKTNSCPYCAMLKNFLNNEGLAYKEVNVQMDQQAASRLIAATPQTEINGQWVLGFDLESIRKYLK